jgi:hypothetical protein
MALRTIKHQYVQTCVGRSIYISRSVTKLKIQGDGVAGSSSMIEKKINETEEQFQWIRLLFQSGKFFDDSTSQTP